MPKYTYYNTPDEDSNDLPLPDKILRDYARYQQAGETNLAKALFVGRCLFHGREAYEILRQWHEQRNYRR